MNFEKKEEKVAEKETEQKGAMDLWNVNIVNSITDLNEVQTVRKSSSNALKKKQSSIENMDILTFAPYTLTAPPNLIPTMLSPNKILSQIKEELESSNFGSQKKLANFLNEKFDFLMQSKGYN